MLMIATCTFIPPTSLQSIMLKEISQHRGILYFSVTWLFMILLGYEATIRRLCRRSLRGEESVKVSMCQSRNERTVSLHIRLIIDKHKGLWGWLTCLSELLLKGCSGGPACQSINFLSGSHQAAIWKLTRALIHGALQLSGAASVYCVELSPTINKETDRNTCSYDVFLNIIW